MRALSTGLGLELYLNIVGGQYIGGKEGVVSTDVCCGWKRVDFLGYTWAVASQLGGGGGKMEGWWHHFSSTFEMIWPAGSAQSTFLKPFFTSYLLSTSASCSLISCF